MKNSFGIPMLILDLFVFISLAILLSLLSSPWVTERTILDSSTVLVIWPIVSKDEAMAITPYLETLPYVGFNPTVWVKLAGCLTEPPVSVPMAIRDKPAATEAAEPLDDPPGTKSVFQGFLIGPKSEFSPDAP